MYSRSICFFSLCLTQTGVGESCQPVRDCCQFQHTEDSRVNARLSELPELPDLYGERSSSPSKSLTYSIKNARIRTDSNISSGRSLSFYSMQHLNIAWTPTVGHSPNAQKLSFCKSQTSRHLAVAKTSIDEVKRGLLTTITQLPPKARPIITVQ